MSKKDTNLPNFIVAGTAKAGTTTLYEHLIKSKEVFPLKLKEPSFFSFTTLNNHPQSGKGDLNKEKNTPKTFNEYKNLYAKSKGFKAVGDFSPDYLYYHKESIPQIKAFLGEDVKIILILRNPVHRAISAYKHMRRDLREHMSFEDALAFEKERIVKNYAMIWHYKNAGFYYEGVKDFMENFKNVKVLIFDDFIRNNNKFIYEIYSFLEVEPIKINTLNQKHNSTYVPKSILFQKLITWDNPIKKFVERKLPNSVKNFIKRKNTFKEFQISYETKLKLSKKFKEDRVKLEKLLDIDLSIWDIKK
jgi:hypothetical protein